MKDSELMRLAELYSIESDYYATGAVAIAGLDEVGRGSVAGPLTVGACILVGRPDIEFLNDSKKLTEKRREIVAQAIKESQAIYSTAHVPPEDIDEIGIVPSLKRAMKQALSGLSASPDIVLLDGNELGLGVHEISIVKGDSKVACIAAASVLAKVERDDIMRSMDELYPEYEFGSNKGYASTSHIQAIKKYGLTPIHRATFCRNFLQNTLF